LGTGEMKNGWRGNNNTVAFINEPFTKLSRTKLNNKIQFYGFSEFMKVVEN